jgi:hypothetical protein
MTDGHGQGWQIPTFFLGPGLGIWVSGGYQLGIRWVSAGYQLGIKGFSWVSAHFEQWPCLSTLMNIIQSYRDLGAMSYWDIGKLNPHLIYQQASQFIPNISCYIIEEEIDTLPQYQLSYWQDERDSFWQCRYCSFWCELFDQRMMESHLLTRCDQVPLTSSQFHLTLSLHFHTHHYNIHNRLDIQPQGAG